MLKPRYIEELPEAMIALYSQVEMDILADMARRINTYDYYIPSAQWQQRKLAAMGNYHSFVTKALASRTAMTEKEIERLMEEAGAKAIAFDDAVYQRMGLHPPPLAASSALLATLEAGKRNTKGLFENLCRTTAAESAKQFTNALDRAYLQILSGAFDRNTAVKMAIKNLAKEGVEAVEYPSGRRDTLEVAVRRAVVTGVNQTCLKLQEMRADEMGCDLVGTTAHGGARPDHAKWQGKVFSRSGTSRKYEDFAETTGYGTGEGLGGWNCRHSFYPYYEGDSLTYSQEMLDDYQAKKYTYNGEQLTEYEASQKQRYIERQIRRWKRENIAMNAPESASKVAYWQGKQRDFIKQTGLKRQYDREQLGHSIPESNENRYRRSARKQLTRLTEQERVAITQYTGNSAYEINRRLAYGLDLGRYREQMALLDSALAKGVVTEDITVIRKIPLEYIGLPSAAIDAAKLDIGILVKLSVTNQIFTSTSLIDFDYPGRDTILNIKIPKGAKGAMYIKDIASNKYRFQEEVLFSRGLKLQITGAKMENNRFYIDMKVMK